MTVPFLAQVQDAKAASRLLRLADGHSRNAFLSHLASGLRAVEATLLEANARDIAAATGKGIGKVMIDRLALDQKRIAELVKNAEEVRALADPLGQISEVRALDNGMRLERRRIPLGVLMLVYEARPSATIEASCLAVKSGNAIVLRGGSEAEHSNKALGVVLAAALAKADLPPASATVLTGASREDTIALVQRADLIDLVIPRGGAQLINTVRAHARMPVLGHGQGICHVYIDKAADLAKGVSIAVNSKANRPSTCNSAETLLVHAEVAAAFLSMFAKAYMETGGELRLCERSAAILAAVPHKAATETDFATEHLANILNVKVVASIDDAHSHIERFGTRHTETIVTNSLHASERFCREVDASCVLVNASTRLNDGYCLGFGAELGISTSKFHAFGPMGLSALTIEKNVAVGDGQTRG